MSAALDRLLRHDAAVPSGVSVAVAVGATSSAGFHAGIVYLDSARLRLIHLAFHTDLRRNDFPFGKYAWVVPPLNRDDAMLIAAFCKRIWQKQPRLPYQLRWVPGTTMSADASQFIPAGDCGGLTCATFVMMIFGCFGIRLVDEDSWLERCDDIAAQRRLLEMFGQRVAQYRAANRTKEADELESHAVNVAGEIGSKRYRASDVAAACTASKLPADFRYCNDVGKQIEQVL